MNRIATFNAVTPKSATASQSTPAKSMSEDEATQIMWVYYRDNKSQLVAHIKEYRAHILEQLMAGVAVDQVFAPFFKPVETAKPLRRAA